MQTQLPPKGGICPQSVQTCLEGATIAPGGTPPLTPADGLSDALQGAVDRLHATMTTEQSRLFRTAYRITHNSHDAQDCLQSAYVYMLEHVRDIQERNIAGYLQTVVRNSAIDCRRKRQNREYEVSEHLPAPAQINNALVAQIRAGCTTDEARVIDAYLYYGSSLAIEASGLANASTVRGILARIRRRITRTTRPATYPRPAVVLKHGGCLPLGGFDCLYVLNRRLRLTGCMRGVVLRLDPARLPL